MTALSLWPVESGKEDDVSDDCGGESGCGYDHGEDDDNHDHDVDDNDDGGYCSVHHHNYHHLLISSHDFLIDMSTYSTKMGAILQTSFCSHSFSYVSKKKVLLQCTAKLV
jgi:hypothetical protein